MMRVSREEEPRKKKTLHCLGRADLQAFTLWSFEQAEVRSSRCTVVRRQRCKRNPCKCAAPGGVFI